MGKTQSTPGDTCNAQLQTIHLLTTTEDVDAHGQIDIGLIQNVVFIWLDESIDEQDDANHNTITQLNRVVNNIYIYTDSDECIEFIQTIVNRKVYIITSGSLGQDIVPQLHDMSQVDSIFIFCQDKTVHKSWAKEWSKIKGVFTNIKHICKALKQALQDCKQNATSISFVTRGEGSSDNLTQLDSPFMYTQIFKEILLTMEFKPKHIQEFIEYCQDVFADIFNELENVKKLEEKYREETPIWWYTYECFLYRMLNDSLRLTDADMMVKMGFFIVDLHRQIEQLHSQQFNEHNNSNFIVYRGQGLSKDDFEQIQKSNRGGSSCSANRRLPSPHEVIFLFSSAETKKKNGCNPSKTIF